TMSTKKVVLLERLLPGFVPPDKSQQFPLLLPSVVHDPCRETKQEREEYEEEDPEEEFHDDGWTHASPEQIEYCVRGYNDELDFLEMELSCATELYSRTHIRLHIMHCLDERDELIIEHTRFFPHRKGKLDEARRTRISKDPTRVIRAYEERV